MRQITKPKEYVTELLQKVVGNKHGTIVGIKAIHTGYTNESFMVTYSDGRVYQVRLPHCGDLINRSNELQVLDITGNNLFVYFNKTTGVAVKKWIPGACPHIPTWKRWKHTDQLFTLIKKIHATKLPSGHKIKAINFESYNKNLYRLKIAIQTKFLSIIDAYNDDKLVLNHTDINAENLVLSKNGKLQVIDFEWSALASDYWDYANFIRESNIRYNKIDWSKYIDNFNMQKLKDYIFASAVYAYLWTWSMPDSKKIRRYRIKTVKQIHRCYHGVYQNEK